MNNPYYVPAVATIRLNLPVEKQRKTIANFLAFPILKPRIRKRSVYADYVFQATDNLSSRQKKTSLCREELKKLN